jgi:uncharacterized protein GlcG (DUF336 family)
MVPTPWRFPTEILVERAAAAEPGMGRKGRLFPRSLEAEGGFAARAPLVLFHAAKNANIGRRQAPGRVFSREWAREQEENAMAHTLKFAGLAFLMTAVVPPSTGIAQVLMQRDVSLHMALTIAEAAIDDCAKTGNDVSVAVVDRAGRLRVFLQGDKAAPHNIELAQRKAYTARTFGRTSAEWADRTGPTSELAGQRELEHVIPLKGGVPIKVGNETIGAVGVSGSTSGGDEGCAMAGVAKVADQLK